MMSQSFAQTFIIESKNIQIFFLCFGNVYYIIVIYTSLSTRTSQDFLCNLPVNQYPLTKLSLDSPASFPPDADSHLLLSTSMRPTLFHSKFT